MRTVIRGLMDTDDLAAIVYPTSPRRPGRVDVAPAPSGGGGRSATRYANLTGFPDLIVPAGFTGDGLPVGLSFLGRAFDEPRLLGLGLRLPSRRPGRRRLPVHTPPLGP